MQGIIQYTRLKVLLETVWVFPSDEAEENLERYFLLYWDAAYFLEHMELLDSFGNPQPHLTKGDTSYRIIFHRCKLAEIKQAALSNSRAQVSLSFRKPKSILNMQPVVLVSLSVRM